MKKSIQEEQNKKRQEVKIKKSQEIRSVIGWILIIIGIILVINAIAGIVPDLTLGAVFGTPFLIGGGIVLFYWDYFK